mgnify:CR=1 FL=1
METLRERIKNLLMKTKEPLTVDEIALRLGVDRENIKDIYEHLRHVAKTIRRESSGKLVLYMLPPMCRNCGYVFKNLNKPRKPSKCPKCGSQRIDPPRFIISEA